MINNTDNYYYNNIFVTSDESYGGRFNFGEYTIECHNKLVTNDDLVIHISNFGDFEYVKYLNGDHLLLLDDHDYTNNEGNYDNNESRFSKLIKLKNNFIVKDNNGINLLIDNLPSKTTFSNDFKKIIGQIYITHDIANCKYDWDSKKLLYADDGRLIMNLFGHTPDRCNKFKKYGLNVSVGCNNRYPLSVGNIEWYILNVILPQKYHNNPNARNW